MGTIHTQRGEQCPAVPGVARDRARTDDRLTPGVAAAVIEDPAVVMGEHGIGSQRDQFVGQQGRLDEHDRLTRPMVGDLQHHLPGPDGSHGVPYGSAITGRGIRVHAGGTPASWSRIRRGLVGDKGLVVRLPSTAHASCDPDDPASPWSVHDGFCTVEEHHAGRPGPLLTQPA